MRFLANLGVEDFVGVDGDPRIIEELPEALAESVQIADFADFFSSAATGRRFDRGVLVFGDATNDLVTKHRRRVEKRQRLVMFAPNSVCLIDTGI